MMPLTHPPHREVFGCSTSNRFSHGTSTILVSLIQDLSPDSSKLKTWLNSLAGRVASATEATISTCLAPAAQAIRGKFSAA
ncbi:hypothetical protein BOTBODRAFT_600300 [Botryobasidium botryosum FD-172 SS1]|uniref:Uncharacterized protein n=1 Tax=Botryobasidium botryosum (strain FD-172 SS1) TaxID=930990 RepID=A0A067MN61_BOTB1|nr:hypothetical protein BOTBODRAFT_600300 [Botryobasidium botryosum FD-172 SS1]